ncbi:MAG: hypothetical protein RIR79_820 [Pseudomonadota bacterium]|jgi:hypothetical protein
MTPDIIHVKTLPNYWIQAEFQNGEIRRFDMKPYLSYPAFSSLKENTLFEKATVLHGTVAWNEEIDLSPDTVYLAGQSVFVAVGRVIKAGR